jgi:hypothetical protein
MPRDQQDLDLDKYNIPRKKLLTKSQSEFIEFDEFNLNEEFTNFAGRHADWGAMYARAYKRSKVAKHNSEIAWSKAFLKLQAEANTQSGKKPTVETLKAQTTIDEEYVEAYRIYVLADAEREKLKVFLDAIESKRDMMRSLGAKFRAEMSGDPAVRDYIRDEERNKTTRKDK